MSPYGFIVLQVAKALLSVASGHPVTYLVINTLGTYMAFTEKNVVGIWKFNNVCFHATHLQQIDTISLRHPRLYLTGNSVKDVTQVSRLLTSHNVRLKKYKTAFLGHSREYSTHPQMMTRICMLI
jgi:hypothetical protein